MAERTCNVESCSREASARGWCNTHYERWRNGSQRVDQAGDLRLQPIVGTCSVEGCERRHSARDLCTMHYQRLRLRGDVGGPDRERDYGSYRSVLSSGYVRVWCPGHPAAHAYGYALEHRKVVMDAGVEIPDGWHVHHVNGVKDDNRIENLQVLSASEHESSHFTGCNQYGHRCGREQFA